LPPAQNVDTCCIGSGPDNTVRTWMSGWARRNASTSRSLVCASSGLALKKNVSASSALHPADHRPSDAPPSTPAPRNNVRRGNR